MRDPPLILKESSPVAMINLLAVIVKEVGLISVCPSLGVKRIVGRRNQWCAAGRANIRIGRQRHAGVYDHNAVGTLRFVNGVALHRASRGGGTPGLRDIGRQRGSAPVVVVVERSEIGQAINRRRSGGGYEQAGWSEARKVIQTQNVVAIETKFPDVIALDPGNGIGELHAALVFPVVGAEVVAQLQVVEQTEIGLAGHAGEVVVPPGVLHQGGVDQVGLQGGD